MSVNGKKHDDATKPRFTPDPRPTAICLTCHNGPALLDNFCEPCYRALYLTKIFSERDKLYARLSIIDMELVRHEAKLKNAKVSYNKAEKQNWTCSRGCGAMFSYYGELFAHEAEKACNNASARAQRRNAKLDEGIV